MEEDDQLGTKLKCRDSQSGLPTQAKRTKTEAHLRGVHSASHVLYIDCSPSHSPEHKSLLPTNWWIHSMWESWDWLHITSTTQSEAIFLLPQKLHINKNQIISPNRFFSISEPECVQHFALFRFSYILYSKKFFLCFAFSRSATSY